MLARPFTDSCCVDLRAPSGPSPSPNPCSPTLRFSAKNESYRPSIKSVSRCCLKNALPVPERILHTACGPADPRPNIMSVSGPNSKIRYPIPERIFASKCPAPFPSPFWTSDHDCQPALPPKCPTPSRTAFCTLLTAPAPSRSAFCLPNALPPSRAPWTPEDPDQRPGANFARCLAGSWQKGPPASPPQHTPSIPTATPRPPLLVPPP